MPSANNAGTQIHYEVEGTGPALVLQHGFTQSLEDWGECGYVDALRGMYLRWSPKFGQRLKLGLLLTRTDLNDGQTEAVFCGFQGEGCS